MTTVATLPQTLTPYHAKYYAYELTRRCPPDSDDRLANALVDAQVDLNPHQIDAALFSFKSPLSRGVLLADEVGLVSIIDDQVFGDLKSFREQFSDLTQEQVFATLKRRLAPLCHRTLRRQVTAYVSYTRRLPLVEQFTPDESEDRLYDLVSEYLRRDNLKALQAYVKAVKSGEYPAAEHCF